MTLERTTKSNHGEILNLFVNIPKMTKTELVGKYLTRILTGSLCDSTSLFIIIGRSDVERGRECKIAVCRTSEFVGGGGGGVIYILN